ncbi:MAG: 50S ribosomal protein L35 [Caldiserica bacterium]|nr:MAG: 50S ribosomal protein L35 [Caldisericota bacterium]
MKKTHKGTKKRFKITKGGKIIHKRAGKSHLLSKKSKRRKRELKIEKELKGKDRKAVRRLLGV